MKASPFFGIICDGATDVTGQEQVTLCLRWVEPELRAVREEYVGFYNIPDTKADMLFSAIADMITRLGLNIHLLRGHCFDGAANMSGRFTGVQKRITDAVTTH